LNALFALGLSACGAAIPPTYPWKPNGQYRNDGYTPSGATKPGTPGDPGYGGRDFCRDLANRAQVRAGRWNGAAWAFTLTAGAAAAAGAVSIATSDDPGNVRKGFNTAAPLLSGLLSTAAFALFERQKSLDALAATASAAVNAKKDQAAAIACNEAIADWNAARANVVERAIKQLDEETPAEPSGGETPAAPASAPADGAGEGDPTGPEPGPAKPPDE
jgi:hypothetical protein